MMMHDRQTLKDAFATYMTGVTVVTARSACGRPVGFTANSFTSVSLDPPLLLVCAGNHLSSYSVFKTVEHFAVNVLAASQRDVSKIFASSKGDRFSQVDWQPDAFASPLLCGAASNFSCTTHKRVLAGDHTILIGRVHAVACNGEAGLGYARSGYFSLPRVNGGHKQADLGAA